ncbi:MAG: HD domain-containing protein [Candidatus Peregrinibacteria bacterium]
MSMTTAEFTAAIKRIEAEKKGFDSDRVMRAFSIAQELVGKGEHWAGGSILEHVLGVFEILLPFQPDEDAIIAALLHHALRTKNGMTLVDIAEQFGPKVRSIVGEVHLLSNVTLKSRRNSIEDLRLMLLSVSDDLHVILITLCDRCRLLDQFSEKTGEEARRVASDVLNLFAPVAARLGIYALKHCLERKAFPICYPSDAERIQEQLAQVREKKGGFLERTARELVRTIGEQGMQASMEYREKETYSIFRKMCAKSITHVEDVRDLFAIRLIVPTAEECYRVLGVLHQVGRPVANRFKDYIAFPKPNGYQSLHTTLAQLPAAPQDTFIEVQIRSETMHREAKYGIAAHWSYKEHGATRAAMEHAQLHAMLSSQEEVAAGSGQPVFADHIFVLTPKGEIIELPEGATPLDFAFQVHTDLGLAFKSAKVNGSIVPLDHTLENGDVVEVQKFSSPRPSPQWMQLLHMASSRSKLKRHLYAERRDEFIVRGKEITNAELAKHHLPPLDTDLSVFRFFDQTVLPLVKREDLLMKIGQEAEKVTVVLSHLRALKKVDFSDAASSSPLHRRQRKDALVEIESGLPMPIRYAKCCKPSEGKREKIIGVVSRSGEVILHREKCKLLSLANPERRVKARWLTGVKV